MESENFSSDEMSKASNDPMGQAMLDYFNGIRGKELLIASSVEEEGPMDPAHFFRNEVDLAELEKTALEYCRGKVLDVGAGAGCHTLILQSRGFDVQPIEISSAAVKTMQARGIGNARQIDFYDLGNEKYDTILLLMNGFGITESLNGLEKFFIKAMTLLNPGGQIIADSADIIYAYQEEDESVYLNLNSAYYGEVNYTVKYDGATASFPWLFVDYFTVNDLANKVGLQFELLEEGDYYNYLCRLKME